ncbi:amidohydrolase, partial [bacterium]|nr:amidohydrolase [bacterium]
MPIDFKAQAEALHEELVARRRDFHQHPELAFQEVRTAGIVAQELQALGLEVQAGVGRTGVVGVLEGAHDGPTVLVRADMDALPIHEENQVDYTSQSAGVMHACGHDGHTTIALGVAKLLSMQREHMAGRVKFVFQPAEEIVAGARAMVEDGVLQAPRPDVTLGLHLWNTLPLGVIGAADGPVMAGSSVFEIIITGRGGHAAAPHLGSDPVLSAAQIIIALQSITSRNVDPLESAVVSVTMMQGSDADNIIPERVKLSGTFRAYKREVRDLVERRLVEISAGIAAAMNCTASTTVAHGTEPVANHPDVAVRVRPRLGQIVGTQNIQTSIRTMGAEDVGLFM